ncbi:MAG: hypothetical protein PHP03_02290 [Candidatus Pacebacteria bacterium]|nr:hypothetical protein [Candidatus Paceibacterota bacterium]
MEKNCEKLFNNLNQEEPPKELYCGILARIQFERRRAARIRLVFFAGTALASIFGLIPALQYFIGELNSSGFHHYISLIFSDGGILISYWKEFILSLAESLPILGITAILSLVFIFLESIKFILRNVKTALINKKQLI